MLEELERKINRPEQDDFYDHPDELYAALTEAQSRFRRRAVGHAESMFREVYEEPLTAEDSTGETYTLPDDHFGEVRLFTPPGPRHGRQIPPVEMGGYYSGRAGFYQNGLEITLTKPKVYDPGLYLVWVPKTTSDLDANTQPVLPSYFDWAVIYEAAAILVQKPGSMIDPAHFRRQSHNEWRGHPDVLDDMGILGILTQQRDLDGQSHLRTQHQPWWHRIE